MNLFELYNVLKDGRKGRNNFLVTVIQGNGTGSRYFLADGEVKAQCGSGDIETERLRELVQPGESGIAEADGRRLFVESLKQPAHLVICGAGHVAQQVILLAGKVGFTVTVLEDRVSFAGEALRAGADQVICDSFENALKQIPGSEDTYFLVVTRGHRYDRVCLEAILKKPYAYVGMMASRGRSALLKKQMEEDGFDRKVLDEIHTPVGLDIHAETPEEIPTMSKKEKQVLAVREAVKLFNIIKDTERYKNLYLYNYAYESGDAEQFSAITIEISNKLVYVSFEGTDHLVSGWKENFMLSYQFPVLSQRRAIDYVNKHFLFRGHDIILGGHSRVGN